MAIPLATVAATMAGSAAAKLGGTLINKIYQAHKAGKSVSSLADLARPARVEPLAIIDATLVDQPYMTDVMRLALTTFTGYYLQAAARILNIERLHTVRVLDSLNPHRTLGPSVTAQLKDAVWSKESYAHGLPSMEALAQPLEPNLVVSVEATGEGKASVGVDDESTKKFYEIENLAVGKLVSIEVKEEGGQAKLPVLVRLVPSKVPPRVLVHIFTATAKNSTWRERYHLWRAGQISLVRDLMFSIDLIDEHRKALINDTSNVYMAINERRSGNVRKSIATEIPSMADASNIAVISTDTAKQIGRAMNGKLDSVNVRKKLFDATYLILLIVVDEEWERVTIYHRGLEMPTTASFREIKSAEKGKGPDITEILKAYQLGSTPTI